MYFSPSLASYIYQLRGFSCLQKRESHYRVFLNLRTVSGVAADVVDVVYVNM
jgi:hypothetical protein